MEEMTQIVKDMAISYGACAVGISTIETLKGGPPSSDLTYMLPDAKSALSFAVPLDQSLIEPYLKKEDHKSHNINNIRTNTLASGISLEISCFLELKGYTSFPLTANLVYRKDTKNGYIDELPPVSHRYLAVRSGVGHFGLSGNVITETEGAAIILGSVVTRAELIPTDPLPEDENYCDNCRLCMASCASGLMDENENVTVMLGGVEFSYSKRRHHNRCDYICGGFSGLHNSGKWSTWSPGRFPIPDKDEEFLPALAKSVKPYIERPKNNGVFYHFLMPGYKVEYTCGNCQLVCHPEKEVRKQRYKMLTESGVVIQNEDGTRGAVAPGDAEKHISAMSPETRALYE